MDLWHRFNEMLFYRWFLWVLVIINFGGALYGFYWYRDQLADTTVWLWPLVPDSPLSTMLFLLVVIGFLAGWRSAVFQLVAYTSIIKYGIWAVIINAHYTWLIGELYLVNFMLAASHLGMAFEGWLYWRHLRYGLPAVIAAAAWLVLQDVADYTFGLHPYLFSDEQFNLAWVSAVVLTMLLIGYGIKRMNKTTDYGRNITEEDE